MKKTAIILICLLAGMLLQGVSVFSKENIIIVANSIDEGLNKDFIEYLSQERDLTLIQPAEFDKYKDSTYIVILGGHEAPEGTGDIVDTLLTEEEKNSMSAGECLVVNLNVWKPGQVVVVLAGSDREKTAATCEKRKETTRSLFDGIEAVLETVTTDHDSIIFLWPSPILTTDEIAPYAPSPLPEDVTKMPHLIPYLLAEDSWFFWIDDLPYAKYAHPVRFAFFGIESGTFTEYNEEWWPVLNGESLWTKEDEYWDRSYWVYDPGLSRPAPSIFYSRTRAALNEQQESLGHALVVNGWKEGEPCKEDMTEDEKGIAAALGSTGFIVESTRKVREVEMNLKSLARKMNLCDTLMIYITAHGGKGYVIIGGEKFTVSECAKLLCNFEEGVHIFLIVDACNAGSFITDEMKKKAVVIITATSANKCAFRDLDPKNDPNPLDRGSEFTSGFTEKILYVLQEISVDSPKDVYGRIFGKIEEAMISTVKIDAAALNGYSDPQIWKLEVGEVKPTGGYQ